MVEPNKEETDQEKALEALNKRPASFRWTVNGVTFTRADLVKAAEAGSGAIISLAKDLGDPGKNEVPNQLGKRYECKVCGTVVLAVKSGEGRVGCCGQPMELQEPKAIPSSD